MRPRQLLVLLGLLGACKGAGSTVDAPEKSPTGSGGTTPIDLDVSVDGQAGAGGAGAQSEAPTASDCPAFAELEQCGVTSLEASFSASNVLLVIDKSSSMDDQPPGFELKKWDALRAALEPALKAAQNEMSFGLLLYPFGEQAEIPLDCFEGCCEVPQYSAAIQVPIEPGTGSASRVMGALDATAPGGGTPTAAALAAALSYFTTGAGNDLQGPRYVLLATDGGPNCGSSDTKCAADHCTPNLDGACPAEQGNCCVGEGTYCLDDVAVVQQLEALADAGVPTFVIGIPGTESYAEYLNGFATAGGVPNQSGGSDYYAVAADGGVESLTQTFFDITTHLVRSCEVELGATAPDKRLVNVAVDCGLVPFEAGAGWDIGADSPSTLVLAGDTCERIQREGARRIDVVYGCQTVK